MFDFVRLCKTDFQRDLARPLPAYRGFDPGTGRRPFRSFFATGKQNMPAQTRRSALAEPGAPDTGLPSAPMPARVTRRSTPERILDTAEELFALHGYFGRSIREIMQVCGLDFSLARYPFGSKDALFREAIGRRAGAISLQVVASLDALLQRLGDTPPSVEAIVTALSAPAFAHLQNGDA